MTKLTDAFALAVEPPKKDYSLYRDDDQPGFALKVRASGLRTWIYDAKVFGKHIRRDIGNVQLFTAKAARMTAREIGGELRQGIDRNSIARERAAEERASTAARLSELLAPTLDSAAETYIAKANIKPATVKFYTELKDRELAPWANDRIKDIDDHKIVAMHDAICGIVSPNRAAKAVKFVATICIANGLPSPIPRRLKFAKSHPRMARLEPSHGPLIWQQIQGGDKDRRSALAAFLLLTGARSGEAVRLLSGEVDLEGKVVLFKSTKSGNDHRVYLSDVCANIIEPFVSKNPTVPVFGACGDSGNWVKFWRRLNGLPKFSPHDLRKAFAITATELGIPYPVIKKALNHSSNDVTLAHYAQATPSQLRDCWNRVADFYTTTIKEDQDEQPNTSTNQDAYVSIQPDSRKAA